MDKVLNRSSAAYIYEIDGLRGIALTLVVLFHVFGNGRVSGGVDVFLVISAYFLTRKLLSWLAISSSYGRYGGNKAAWLVRHYSGVVAKLVPSLIIMLLGVLAAISLFGLPSQLQQQLAEVRASAFYYENWELIFSQLEYEAAGPETSPLQHIWSLSVQGQFFVVWPIVAFALYAITAYLKRRDFKSSIAIFRASFLILVAVATLGSFLLALDLVATQQQVAYFSSFTRFWELGAGALIAFLPTQFLAHSWIKESAVWLGISMILLSGFLFDGASLFPGVAALWPVGATLLALFGATRDTPAGRVARVLGITPIRYLSRISYQLYLWHWPVLVFYLQVQDQANVGFVGALGVLLVSTVLAIVTRYIVSLPWMTPSTPNNARRIALISVATLIAIAGLTFLWSCAQERAQATASANFETRDPSVYLGAKALESLESVIELGDGVKPLPTISTAADDKPTIYAEGCVQKFADAPGTGEVKVCDVDDYRSADSSGPTVVVSGGSHVTQWYPALRAIAEQEEWRLLVIDKNGCRFSVDSPHQTCREWNHDAVDVIASYDPDLLFTLGSVSDENGQDYIDPATVQVWERFEELDIPIVGIRDTPRLGFRAPECLEQHGVLAQECRVPYEQLYSHDVVGAYAGKLPESFSFIDSSQFVALPAGFVPVIGNTIVYRDDSHLTSTYALSGKSRLESELRQISPELF